MRIVEFFRSLTTPSQPIQTNMTTTTPAARLANGTCSPPTLHANHTNGIHRIPGPEPPVSKELESPHVITSGKFSPPPYLFKGLFNPFDMEVPLSENRSEKEESISSIEKKMEEVSLTSNKSETSEGEEEGEGNYHDPDSWRAPPPSPNAFSVSSSKSSSSSGTRI
ncbi:UNVERIFIED_CONTAM: hypothetical protein RMT77_003986 [Armadillidium vulgare]